jgi:acetylornithine deacetylase/succinyl-diaminopimelate desuccinylase-like protein
MSCRIVLSVQANRARFLEELKSFVRIPSISSQPKHAGDVKRCAAWLAKHLRGVGLERVKVIPTKRHPIVYADWLHAPGRPTVLIYGHYDVQPVEPLSEWQTPPFEPVVRGDNLYGRGASDDKGQLFTHVKAIESYLRKLERLPVNVKCLFEGEEEIGSPNLQSFLTKHRRALAADVAVMSDTRMLAPDRPAITYALRGALSLELEVSGPPQDLHSGNYGGAVHNPLQVLCEIVASLYDSKGRITVPGFYDSVRRWSDRERNYMAHHGPSDAMILRDAGLKQGWGERGYSLYEQTTIRPTLTITGISGGHQGPGGKSIIPARANAKISIRLVPDQVPQEIEQLCRRHITRVTPATVRSSVRTHFATNPALVSRTHPAMRAAIDACRKGFGAAPVFLRSGGSIPVVNSFQTLLGIPTILLGFGLPDDRIHAPNEKVHLPNLYKGIDTCISFLSKLGRTDGIETPCVNNSLCLPRQNFYDDVSSWMTDDLNPG